jgi:hypothetical protein
LRKERKGPGTALAKHSLHLYLHSLAVDEQYKTSSESVAMDPKPVTNTARPFPRRKLNLGVGKILELLYDGHGRVASGQELLGKNIFYTKAPLPSPHGRRRIGGMRGSGLSAKASWGSHLEIFGWSPAIAYRTFNSPKWWKGP